MSPDHRRSRVGGSLRSPSRLRRGQEDDPTRADVLSVGSEPQVVDPGADRPSLRVRSIPHQLGFRRPVRDSPRADQPPPGIEELQVAAFLRRTQAERDYGLPERRMRANDKRAGRVSAGRQVRFGSSRWSNEVLLEVDIPVAGTLVLPDDIEHTVIHRETGLD